MKKPTHTLEDIRLQTPGGTSNPPEDAPLTSPLTHTLSHKQGTLYPLPGLLENLQDLGLPATRFRLVIVLPPSCFRERHEDRFDSPAGLEAEHGSSVVHQVELHVP